MTAEQKKLLRDALMAALVTANPLTLPIGTLRNAAKAAGFKVEDAVLEGHLEYLVDSGLLQVKTERLSKGVVRWKATAEGVDYAEGEGLV